MDLINSIPEELKQFLMVVLFSLLIGMEQRRLHSGEEYKSTFGTDRTMTLIGILGYVLYIISPVNMAFYIGGGILLSAYLGVYYFQLIQIHKRWGMTSILTALLTYALTPMIILQPLWMVMLVFVTILLVVEMKNSLFVFQKKFDRSEFTLLAKFIIIAGIILPLAPHENISEFILISPYQIWISIVAVTSISYISYLLRKFIFPGKGILLSSILGGLYSSTATTLILARKSKEINDPRLLAAGILGATSMMYFRIFFLALIFNGEVADKLAAPFGLLILSSLVYIVIIRWKHHQLKPEEKIQQDKHPLEFKTALGFGILFGFFGWLTHFVFQNYGNTGIHYLSFIVGITDIDPFLLNIFQHIGGALEINTIVQATLIATASNNLMKLGYGLFLGDKSIRKYLLEGFGIYLAIGILLILLF